MPDQWTVVIDELVALRKEKGWSQRKLSAACGLPQAAVGRLERKKIQPTLMTLCKIAGALGAEITISRSEK